MPHDTQWTLRTNRKDDIIRGLAGLYMLLDAAGTIDTVQEELAAVWGYAPEELRGRPFATLLVEPEAYERLGLPEGRTVEVYRKNGTVHRGECIPFVLESETGTSRLLSFRYSCFDAKLNLLQRFAGAFMHDVNLGVLLIDTDFRLVDLSDTACRVLGIAREEAMGRPMEDIFAALPSQHQLVQRTLLDGVVVKNHAVSWTNNQERYELIMDTSLLKDYEGNTVGAYVMFKDVSNLRSLEQQVQRSDRLAMIGQIAAGTAHEIRNPLTSIKGFLQVLKQTFKDKQMAKEHSFTEIMLTEIDRINDLVSEFLLLSKPKHTTLTKVDVPTVIREIMPFISNEAILHGVLVEYQSAVGLPPVLADRELLKQVFINLSKNGIEAMAAEGGTLTIQEKVDPEERRLNVLVQDTGPGIPSFLIDKIFDPFFTTKEEGTGLGLSVCQRIVHDIGGSIRVSSKGYGTMFVVSIPYAED